MCATRLYGKGYASLNFMVTFSIVISDGDSSGEGALDLVPSDAEKREPLRWITPDICRNSPVQS